MGETGWIILISTVVVVAWGFLKPQGGAYDDPKTQMRKLTREKPQLVPALVCPHCQTKGKVTRKLKEKFRKEQTKIYQLGPTEYTKSDGFTHEHRCGNCSSVWNV
jgi:hypothetical protein